ncbi:hypothetical protein EAG_10220 [Camponotus floridanus]|uniref:Uncharacterized protein n=1 Tax=Camponotus floridanus TaxID=104421 RepID=E1ZZK5_CAMFO|nr:hypothetical protein EAG_10220 [Camponotus floridanus]
MSSDGLNILAPLGSVHFAAPNPRLWRMFLLYVLYPKNYECTLRLLVISDKQHATLHFVSRTQRNFLRAPKRKGGEKRRARRTEEGQRRDEKRCRREAMLIPDSESESGASERFLTFYGFPPPAEAEGHSPVICHLTNSYDRNARNATFIYPDEAERPLHRKAHRTQIYYNKHTNQLENL